MFMRPRSTLGDDGDPNDIANAISTAVNSGIQAYQAFNNAQLQQDLIQRGYIPPGVSLPGTISTTPIAGSSDGLFWIALIAGGIFLLNRN